MKPLLIFALLALAYGEYSSEYQEPQDSLAVLEEIETLKGPSNKLIDNGYHYKNAASDFAAPLAATSGYRYKTVRKLRRRIRRDVNELTQYLPPAQDILHNIPSNEYLAPVAPISPIAEIVSNDLADDGYRYKTIRRLRFRHRRDINELNSAQYLPPIQKIPQTPIISEAPVVDIPVISNEYLAPLQQNENILADDGYRYKTIRRFKIRRH